MVKSKKILLVMLTLLLALFTLIASVQVIAKQEQQDVAVETIATLQRHQLDVIAQGREMTVGTPTTINGIDFTITSDGKYQVGGEVVADLSTFDSRLDAARKAAEGSA